MRFLVSGTAVRSYRRRDLSVKSKTAPNKRVTPLAADPGSISGTLLWGGKNPNAVEQAVEQRMPTTNTKKRAFRRKRKQLKIPMLSPPCGYGLGSHRR